MPPFGGVANVTIKGFMVYTPRVILATITDVGFANLCGPEVIFLITGLII